MQLPGHARDGQCFVERAPGAGVAASGAQAAEHELSQDARHARLLQFGQHARGQIASLAPAALVQPTQAEDALRDRRIHLQITRHGDGGMQVSLGAIEAVLVGATLAQIDLGVEHLCIAAGRPRHVAAAHEQRAAGFEVEPRRRRALRIEGRDDGLDVCEAFASSIARWPAATALSLSSSSMLRWAWVRQA